MYISVKNKSLQGLDRKYENMKNIRREKRAHGNMKNIEREKKSTRKYESDKVQRKKKE
jgi:hypothetical protein